MRFVFPALLAALLYSAGVLLAAAAPQQNATTVTIDNYAFKPPSLTVTLGTTVTFRNADDDPHTVTSTDGLFDSKGLGQGDTWTYRFTKPGTYTYFCKVHPYMKGTIVVKETGS